MFCFAIDTFLVLQSDIPVSVYYVLVIINTLYNFHDQSKISIQYSKLVGIHEGVILVESTSPHYRTALAAFTRK